LNTYSGFKLNTFLDFSRIGVQVARMTVQVARIIPNALFIKPDYPYHLLWKRYVSEENSNAKIKRSTQAQLLRRIKHPENQCQHQNQCRQHPKHPKDGRAIENHLAATGGLG
jgi:hypothetical protein